MYCFYNQENKDTSVLMQWHNYSLILLCLVIKNTKYMGLSIIICLADKSDMKYSKNLLKTIHYIF